MKRSLQLNPDNKPCEKREIKEWRDIHEVSPVNTSFGMFDADPKSDQRMDRSIRRWDDLQTLDENGKLHWKLADNSFLPMTKAELEQVYIEIDIARAARASILHYKAAVFEQQDPLPLLKEVKDIAFWLQ